MKLKYYLRGLGIGIIATTIILMICFSQEEPTVSDEMVIERAKALGMIMPQEMEEASETEETDESQQTDMTSRNEVNHTGQAVQTDNTKMSVPSEAKEVVSSETEEMASSETGEMVSSETKENHASEAAPPDVPTETTAQPSGTYNLIIRQGDVCRTVCDTLKENGVISDSEGLRLYLSEIGYASQLSTGRYDIPYGITMEEVAQVLAAGPIERLD